MHPSLAHERVSHPPVLVQIVNYVEIFTDGGELGRTQDETGEILTVRNFLGDAFKSFVSVDGSGGADEGENANGNWEDCELHCEA